MDIKKYKKFNNKASGGILLIIIIVIIIITCTIVVLSNTPSGNFKIIVTGSVTRSRTGSWSVSVNQEHQLEDTYLNLLGWIPDIHWPWETGLISIKCIMTNTKTSESYVGNCDAGRVGSWLGGSTSYRLEIRNVPMGRYKINVKVYEGDESRISKNIGSWVVG